MPQQECKSCKKSVDVELLVEVKTRDERAPEDFFASTEQMCPDCVQKWKRNPGCDMWEEKPGVWIREWRAM